MKSYSFIFILSLCFLFAGCISDPSIEGGDPSSRGEFTLKDSFIINSGNENSFSIEGECTFSGGAVLRFYKDSKEKRIDIACDGESWTVDVEGLSEFDDGEVFMEILVDDKPLLKTPFTFNKDTEIPTFTEAGDLDGFIVQVSDHLVRASGTCSEDGEVSVDFADIGEDWVMPCEAGAWSGDLDFSAQAHGSYNFEITFTDEAGNEAAATILGSLDRDTESPETTIADPDPVNAGTTTYAFSGACEDDTTLVFSVDNTPIANAPDCSSGSWSVPLADLGLSSDGTYQLKIAGTDSAGNEEEETKSLLRDTVLPIVTITTGTNSWSWNCDSGETCDEYSYALHDSTTLPAPASFSAYSDVATASVIEPGTHHVHVKARDAAGNESESVASGPITINPVTISGVTGASGSYKDGASVTLSVTFSASVDIAASSTLSLVGADGSTSVGDATLSGGAVDNVMTADFTYEVGTGDHSTVSIASSSGITIAEGAAVLSVSSSVAVSGLVIDNTAPEVTITDPGSINAGTTSYAVSGTCENGATLALSVGDDAPIENAPSCSAGSWSVSLADLGLSSDGTYPLKIAGTDSAGNEGEETKNLLRDTVPPTVTITKDSGVNSWSWSCDGGEACTYSYLVSDSASAPTSGYSGYDATTTASVIGVGANHIYVRARDAAGNESESVATSTPITIDDATISEVTGASGSYKQGVSLTLSVTFSAPVDIAASSTLALSSGGTATSSNVAQFNVTTADFTYTTPLGDHSSVSITASNGITVAGEAISITVDSVSVPGLVIDNTVPAVTITVGTNSWSWSCDDSEACTYSYLVSDSASTPADSYPAYDVTTTTPVVAPGTYYVHVKAKDAAGNESASKASGSITINPVTISEVTGASGFYKQGASVTLSVTFSAPVDIAASSTLALSSGGAAISSNVAQPNVTAAGFIYTVPLGDHSSVSITSSSGITIAGETISITVDSVSVSELVIDNTVPVVTITKNSGANSWSWSCDGGETCTYSRALNGSTTPPAPASFSAYGDVATASVIEPGTHHVHVKARDAAGNESASVASDPITIDDVTISSVTGAGSYKHGSTITLGVTFSASVDIAAGSTLSLVLTGDGPHSGTAALSGGAQSGTGTASFTYTAPSGNYSEISIRGSSGIRIAGGTTALSVSLVSPFIVSGLVIDNTAPEVTITDPDPINAGNQAGYIVRGTCGDSATLVFSVNDAPPIANAPDCSSGSWSVPLADLGLGSDGTYQLKIVGTDSAGNTGEETKSLLRDTVPPTVTVTTGTNSWSWSCDGGETCGYSHLVSNLDEAPDGGYLSFGASTEFSVTATSGTYYIYVKAEDAAGNVSEVATGDPITITRGGVASLAIDASDTTLDVAVVPGSEPNSWRWSCYGEKSCEYAHVVSDQKSVPREDEFPTYGDAVKAFVHNPGTHYIHVKARDAEGNESVAVTSSPLCLAGGSGDSIEDPVVICTYEDLNRIREDLNEFGSLHKYYVLGADIDATPSWSSGAEGCAPYDGESIASENPCSGWVPLPSLDSVFNGKDHKIEDLYMNAEEEAQAGLFRSEAAGSFVENLHLRRMRIHTTEESELVDYSYSSVDSE